MLDQARYFAIDKFRTRRTKSGITYIEYLDEIVNRLKSIGIIDQEILAAGILYDILENSDTTFEEVFEKFGRRIAVIVSSLTRDSKISIKERELQYIRQIKNANFESKIIIFCAICTDLKDIQKSNLSKSQRNKNLRKKSHLMRMIKDDLKSYRMNFPKINEMVNGINYILSENKQRIIEF